MRAFLEETLAFKLPSDWEERIDRLYELLRDANARFNLTRLTSREDFFSKHVADSLLAVAAYPDLGRATLSLADVGCGGGLPGLVLALTFPRLATTEVDSTQKKILCVESFIEALGLEGRCRAVARRARELARTPEFRGAFDVVLARAVATTAELLAECRGLLAPRGVLIAYKTPAGVAEEEAATLREARKRGFSVSRSEVLTLPGGLGERQFVVLQQS